MIIYLYVALKVYYFPTNCPPPRFAFLSPMDPQLRAKKRVLFPCLSIRDFRHRFDWRTQIHYTQQEIINLRVRNHEPRKGISSCPSIQDFRHRFDWRTQIQFTLAGDHKSSGSIYMRKVSVPESPKIFLFNISEMRVMVFSFNWQNFGL